MTKASTQIWSVEDVEDVGLGYHGSGVQVMNICCANRSLTMTAQEARDLAAILISVAELSDKVDDDPYAKVED